MWMSNHNSERLLGALTLLVALAFAGCSIDRNLVHDLNFRCADDNDCLSGYFCHGATADTPGVCVSFGGSDAGTCVDADGDECWVGDGCGPGVCRDCNDDDPLINPNAAERCNGIDDNCNGEIDEDIPSRPCPLQMGVCAGSRQNCVDGEWQDCIEEGLYGPLFENVDDIDETCDGIDNNCRGGYPADATPEEIDAHCDCIPGYTETTACGTDIGECERGIKFCQDDGSFSDCVLADMGSTCVSDGDCGGGFCVDEEIDFREDFLDDCQLGSEPACERRICRTLTGTIACVGDGGCGTDEVCVQDFCQLVVQGDVPEMCNGRDDDCNGRIDEGSICTPCPYGMVLLEGVPGIPSRVCMDEYEASRPDATATDLGSNELYAVSREGVLPWTGVDTAAADAACQGTAIRDILSNAVPPRRLCQGPWLGFACDGNAGTYPYGANFVAGSCNDASSGTDLVPTGTDPNCCVAFGDQEVCDLSGNAAELVTTPFTGVFGGSTATQTGDDLVCDVDDIGALSSEFQGFRCCAIPTD